MVTSPESPTPLYEASNGPPKDAKMSGLNEEDAAAYIIECLAKGIRTSEHGYEVYVGRVALEFLRQEEGHLPTGYWEDDPEMRRIFPAFCDGAWLLVRRGILRPGQRQLGVHDTDEGQTQGYSLTEYGRDRIATLASFNPLVLGPARFTASLEPVVELLGTEFMVRAIEAAGAYQSGLYLACCGMSGAAAEAALLAAADTKTGDPEKVRRDYSAAGGRGRIENLLVGQAKKEITAPFKSLTEILKYRRDNSVHGAFAQISEAEAHDALQRLLRFALFLKDHWATITELS